VARVLRRHEPDAALVEVALSAGRILRCDGVRLIVKAPGEALWRTLACHPHGADPGRFSGSVLRMAQEAGTTVAMGQADLAGLPAAESVMLNDIRSVLCAPLELSGPDDGFLYIDRLSGNPPFEAADRALFESLRGLFSELVEAVLRADRQRREIEALQGRPSTEARDLILHQSEAMQKVLREATRVAGTEVPVLVTGETGTGKELMARYLHLSGPRAAKPFVAINCGAIPENLMESELFGHEKGAFTGAHASREGLVESADGGTLFLDEIGEMPLSLQVKLLRVLQQSEVVRVGASQAVPVDFRLVCATNRNLKDEVAAGHFRSDLFFRINVIELKLPPLRDRGRDSILIAHQLVRKYASQYGLGERTLGRLAEKAILEHRWPGNVRELDNVIHKAVILSLGSLISPEDLGMGTAPEGLMELGLESDTQASGSLRAVRDHAEKRCIEAALESARGNISLTARMLDVDRKVLMRIMERLGIQADEHRQPG
jgi:DNA-binding NtrC family response regulator